jgi:hypothetical protein
MMERSVMAVVDCLNRLSPLYARAGEEYDMLARHTGLSIVIVSE